MRKGLLPFVAAFVVVSAFACLAHAQEAPGTDSNQPVRRNPYVGMPVDGWTNQPVKRIPRDRGPSAAPRHFGNLGSR